jgi:hypothetical protein
MTQQQIVDFFKPHAVGFSNATITRLKNDFKIWQQCEDYDNETFAETIDREFWSMGCDYIDYANALVNDYFNGVINKQQFNDLKERYNEFDTKYRNLENYLFETYAMPIIYAIIEGRIMHD